MGDSKLDILWVLVCSVFILMMQFGFLALESGLSRPKNSINVAFKNIVDLVFTVMLYWMIGHAISQAFPIFSEGSVISSFYFFSSPELRAVSFFVFQSLFASTCTTIVSGAVAERIKFKSFLLMVFFIGIYGFPIMANLCWKGTYNKSFTSFLGTYGFIDFAGATVVHSTGGWVALATLLVLGPRIGRFSKDGKIRKMEGSNIPLSAVGTLVLLIGWLGFNGGSSLGFKESNGLILMNTLISGCAGSIVGLFVSMVENKGFPKGVSIIYGLIGGLVGVTGCANIIWPSSAALIGVTSSLVTLGVEKLLIKFQIDDVVGAVPAHLGAGIWGTFCVAIFSDRNLISNPNTPGDFVGMFFIQLFGIFSGFVFIFLPALFFIYLINKKWPIRVSKQAEIIGLNISEHGSLTGIQDLVGFLKTSYKEGDIKIDDEVDSATDNGSLTQSYNETIKELEETEIKTQELLNQIQEKNLILEDLIYLMGHDILNRLSVVITGAQMAKKMLLSQNLPEKDVKILEKVIRGGESIREIVDQIVCLEKIHSGKLNVRPEKFSLFKCINGVVQELSDEFRDKKVSFSLKLLMDSSSVVYGDVKLIKKWVLKSVLLNALKYSYPDGKVVIESQITESGHLQIKIQDHGIGMSADEIKDALAIRRKKLKKGTMEEMGAGFGLPLAQEILLQFGGVIDIKSISEIDDAKNRGTTIFLLFPKMD